MLANQTVRYSSGFKVDLIQSLQVRSHPHAPSYPEILILV